MRSYTVNEIDALRRACEDRWLYGTTNITSSRFSRQWQGSEKDEGVEALVRTCMITGLTAGDIYAADKPPPAPEPRKPREWWIEPMKYGLCRMTEECSDSALWHVREIIE